MSNSRSVSYNKPGGGLNERFSKIVQYSKKSQPTRTVSSGVSAAGNGGTSVFARIRGPSNSNRTRGGSNRSTAGNIQSRLGRVNGGVNKRTSGTASNIRGRVGHSSRGNGSNSRQQQQQRSNNRNTGKGKSSTTQKNKQTPKNKKPLTAEQLDKSLDSYMMKDPTYAQAKLDAELDSYMDDASDILIEGENGEEAEKL